MTSNEDAAWVNDKVTVMENLVAVVIGFEGAVLGNVEVLGLLIAEGGQLYVELLKVSTSDLLVQILG